ncbi:unnamed protein product, partial [Candidula unifasciata]
MDVEGYELESLMAALDEGSLSDVRQLSFETHVAWGKFDPTKEEYIRVKSFKQVTSLLYPFMNLNYVYSAFDSLLVKGKKRAHCHEVHTVNINLKNSVNPDGSIAGDNAVSQDKRKERINQQRQLL